MSEGPPCAWLTGAISEHDPDDPTCRHPVVQHLMDGLGFPDCPSCPGYKEPDQAEATPEAPGALRRRLGGCWSLAAGGRVVHAWEHNGPVVASRFFRPVCGRVLTHSDRQSCHDAPTCPHCLAVITKRLAEAQAQALPADQEGGGQ